MVRLTLLAFGAAAVFGLAQAKTVKGTGEARLYRMNHSSTNYDRCTRVHLDGAANQALMPKKYKKQNACGKKVHVKDTNNGKTFTATVLGFTDLEGKNIGFTDLAYHKLSHPHHGSPQIKWEYDN